METPKDYLQQKIGPCVGNLFEHFLPQQNFKSVYDLFNAQKFFKLLMCILSEQVKSKIVDLNLYEQSQNQTYNEMRRKNFKRIYEIIEKSYEILDLNWVKKIREKEIQKMIECSDLKVMIVLMENIFELLKHNKIVLEFITTLNEEIQNNIMDVMENSQEITYNVGQFDIYSQNSISSLKMVSKISPNQQQLPVMSHIQQMENHMQKMESHIQLKDDEIKDLKFTKQQLQQEIQECKKEIHHKNEQIQMFKKRMVSYEEIDQLMLEKDQEILKLTKKLADHQLKSRLKQSQLTNQNKSLHEKINQLETKDGQLSLKYEKQRSLIQQLNRQKEEAEISMKKVINNLKQKNKSSIDKMNDLQTQLTEVKFEKQMKEKQLNELKLQGNGRKSVSANFVDISSPRSPSKQDINEGIESLTGNYSRLGEQLSIQLDRADLEDDFGLVQRPTGNKRFNELLQQNYTLKQQLQKLQSTGFADSKQSKQLQDEIQKMKKKINILKRRNDQIETQRKQEIDLMVGVIDQCYSQSLNKSK